MEPLYLDYAATTPVRWEVRESMIPYLSDVFGNPSSSHRWGRSAAAALDNARASIAECLGALPGEIHFTRGGTESDNLAVLGVTEHLRAQGVTAPVVVTSVEHKAVLDAANEACARSGGRPITVSVTPDGTVDTAALEEAVQGNTCFVSAMWVNNETGMILPVPEIGEIVSRGGGVLHTDAVQAIGKVPVRLDEVPVTLLTITGHKIYGPKGTGLLFVRSGTDLKPLLFGGGQERARRPGTEDVAGAVGLATAIRLAVDEREAEAERLADLRDSLEAALAREIPGLRVNAGAAERAPHVASVAIPDLDGVALVMGMDLEGVAVSGGAACNSGASRGSHVIAALYGESDAHATLRFSLGRDTTEPDVERAVTTTISLVRRLSGDAGP